MHNSIFNSFFFHKGFYLTKMISKTKVHQTARELFGLKFQFTRHNLEVPTTLLQQAVSNICRNDMGLKVTYKIGLSQESRVLSYLRWKWHRCGATITGKYILILIYFSFYVWDASIRNTKLMYSIFKMLLPQRINFLILLNFFEFWRQGGGIYIKKNFT